MGNFSYHPCQPGYYQVGSKYQELNYSLDCKLGLYICQMFEITEPTERNIRIIPDGCNDILISYDGVKLNSWLSLSIPKAMTFNFNKANWLFGVRFYPGFDRSLFGKKVENPIQKAVETRTLLQDFHTIEEDLINSQSFVRRHEIIEDYLRDKLASNDCVDNIMTYCVHQLIETNGTIPIDVLAEKAGYGTRYLRQLFTKSTGHSPKELAAMIRMQKTLHHILNNTNDKLSDIAIRYGFSDLSHMNREFKKYLGITSSIIKNTDDWNRKLKAEINRSF